MTFDSVTYHLEHLQFIACNVLKLYIPNLNAIEQFAAELQRFQYLT